MARIGIIAGTPLKDSYCEALARAYAKGAGSGGHSASVFVLGDLTFDMLREGYRRAQPLEPDLVTAREAMLAADHLVLVFPLWCGDMPAIMKAFIERVLQPDLLRFQGDNNADWKVFKGKSARVVMTMGMPGWFYRWYYGAHALKLLKRNILGFVGIGPVRSTIFGMIEAAGDDKRKTWLGDIEAMGRDAA